MTTAEHNRLMALGMRDKSGTPLTEKEIEFVKSEIRAIGAEEDVFVFNDERYLKKSTCYDWQTDKIYVTRNVFPDKNSGSIHPRDIMSVRAVLAHEYYGHRYYREEYKSDYEIDKNFHTTPLWQDEQRASLRAAEICENLTDVDRQNLVIDAVYRAQEAGQVAEMTDFMKEIVYGYSKEERAISPSFNYNPVKRCNPARFTNLNLPQFSQTQNTDEFSK